MKDLPTTIHRTDEISESSVPSLSRHEPPPQESLSPDDASSSSRHHPETGSSSNPPALYPLEVPVLDSGGSIHASTPSIGVAGHLEIGSWSNPPASSPLAIPVLNSGGSIHASVPTIGVAAHNLEKGTLSNPPASSLLAVPVLNSGGSIHASTPTIRVADDHHQQPLMLGETVLGLAFQAATALMILHLQTAPSASSSTNNKIPIVEATLAISFLCSVAAIFLRDAHQSAARIGEHAGLLFASIAFLMMVERFLLVGFSWIVWLAGVFLFLAYLYALYKMMK